MEKGKHAKKELPTLNTSAFPLVVLISHVLVYERKES